MDEKLVNMILEWKQTKSIALASDICEYLEGVLDEISNS